MNLIEIFSTDQLVPQFTVADRWAAIDGMIDLLVQLGKLPTAHRQAAAEAVKAREAKTSTGIGYGIALPHASLNNVKDVVAVMAKLSPPVDFQSLDGQPVKLCVLFLTPAGEFQRHLQTLSTLARFLTNKQNRDNLEAAKTADEMLAALRSSA